ncbi:PaiB family negative transcriptional regulator [Ureibacillus xyleni]|uniref:PaiB family negative transcriptional regulator n=1 Tax=Ureibacillus xyleni TaxID=614648 RepID=A0A285TPL1_9BACL|nr:FMN-binding negative transcriptional regulator [Ureibacillus xyleni]SOC25140.1 PaiB family negative transcriptional regulator [Ureibacillus xyleni]
MFIPKYFQVTDFDEISEFIRMNSFGTIVTTENGKPIATHIPMDLIKNGDDDYIAGHMAYANPQWKTFGAGQDSTLVMFQGPHAYISSSWYNHENVPTWNYQSVHVYGTASVMSEQELEDYLTLLLKKYESHRENPVLWEKLSSETKKQIKGTIGFKIKIEEVQASYKLSQNRNEEDYHNIIKKLNEEEDLNSIQLAVVMKNRKPFS